MCRSLPRGKVGRPAAEICPSSKRVHRMETSMTNAPKRLEPRWPAMLALLAVGGLWLAMPESLSVGPDWLLITVVAVLLIPTAWARQRGMDNLTKFLGYLLTSIVTVDMVWSLGLLIVALPLHKESPLD